MSYDAPVEDDTFDQATEIRSRTALVSTAYDRTQFQDAMRTLPTLSRLADRHRSSVPTVDTLLEDVFLSLFRSDVRFVQQENLDQRAATNVAIISRIIGSSAYRRMHPVTEGAIDETVICTEAIAAHLLNTMSDQMKRYIAGEHDYAQAMDEINQEIHAIEEFQRRGRRKRNKPGQNAEDGKPSPEAMTADQRRRRLAELEQQRTMRDQAYKLDYDHILDGEEFGAQMRKIELPAALADVADRIEHYEEVIANLGGATASSEGTGMTLAAKRDLFERLSKDSRIQRITDLVGRMRYAATAAHRKRTDRLPHAIADVQRGDDIARVLVSESVWLADRDTEIEFLRRFVERQLLVYHLEGIEPQARGPIIFCLDESDSMRGHRDEVAKAIALAMLSIAQADGRDLALIEFSSAGSQAVHRFAAGHSDAGTLLGILEHFLGGGTDFDQPLSMALDIIEADPLFATADIMFVTDGESTISEAVRRRLSVARDAGVRLFAVCVDRNDADFHEVATATWQGVDLLAEDRDPRLIADLVASVH